MAEAVVDLLEIVKVDEHQRGRTAGAPGAGEGEIDLLLDEDPVGQAGQRVVVGQVGELLLAAPALADVADDAVEGGAEPARAFDPGDGELHGELAAVAADRSGLDAAVQQARARVVADPLGEAAVEGAILGRHQQIGDLAAQHVIGQVVEGALGGRVELDDAILLVDGDHAVQRPGDHRAVARQRGLERGHLARALDGQGCVGREGAQHHQLLIVGAPPGERLVDRDDPVRAPAGAFERREQRVVGVPALAADLRRACVGLGPVPGDGRDRRS